MKSSKIILPSRTSSLKQLNRLLNSAAYKGRRYFILTDENTGVHCLPRLITEVEAFQESEFLEIESGEQNKSLEIAAELWQALEEMGADRQSVLVNLGGGVVSDLGGFVAAGYKRGISYINIPTSLIGMIDAGVGGKTGVNLGGLKNQVGFFHFPEVVCIEPVFLETLSAKDWTSGVCEMLKTFMVADAQMYVSLVDTLKSDHPVMDNEMIKAAVHIKDGIVKADAYDTGIRKMLNYGHTVGHAVESFSMAHDAEPLSHGQAVGIGLIAETFISTKKMGFPGERLEELKELVSAMVPMPKYEMKDMEELLGYMLADKKNHDGNINCTLLGDLGETVVDNIVTEVDLCEALMMVGKIGRA